MEADKEIKEVDICDPDFKETGDEVMNEITGGSKEKARYYRHRYEREDLVHMKGNYADGYCSELEMEFLNEPKCPCPVCGSWNVTNYDPGVLYT